jgi:hypothetical protein
MPIIFAIALLTSSLVRVFPLSHLSDLLSIYLMQK